MPQKLAKQVVNDDGDEMADRLSSQTKAPSMENEQELIEFLKANLSIEVVQETGFYGEKHASINLIIGGEVISEASINL